MAGSPKNRKRLPNEFPVISPEADLEPDAPKPGPSGEKPPRTRRASPPDQPEPEAPRGSPPGGAPEPTAPVTTGVPAFALPDMPRTVSLVTDSVITRPLAERMAVASEEPIGIVIEVRSDAGLPTEEVLGELLGLIHGVVGETDSAEETAWSVGTYVIAEMTADQILALVRVDSGKGGRVVVGRQEQKTAPRSLINRIWPNFEVTATIHRSIITTKADAAARSFNATGEGIVWAVLDTGVQRDHRHFLSGDRDTLGVPRTLRHRSFVAGTTDDDALRDGNGHGTHVAGIIAGWQDDPRRKVYAATWYRTAEGDTGVQRVKLDRISGMAPRAKILSVKVLRDDRTGDLATLLEALDYIQELNHWGRQLNVHGVNLSLGYPFDPSWFATGQSPVCREVDRLVANGVCVVVSAGNTGYGAARDTSGREMRLSFGMTINDPGNASRAITVG